MVSLLALWATVRYECFSKKTERNASMGCYSLTSFPFAYRLVLTVLSVARLSAWLCYLTLPLPCGSRILILHPQTCCVCEISGGFFIVTATLFTPLILYFARIASAVQLVSDRPLSGYTPTLLSLVRCILRLFAFPEFLCCS
jgi:hypothetical protein